MSIEKMRLCSKAGCGAQRRVGFPCKDWDCPQSYVVVAEYRALLDELSRLREVERRAKEVIRPFAENACGGDGNGFLDVPNEHAARFHDLSNSTSPTLLEGHFRAARDLYRAFSEREGHDG